MTQEPSAALSVALAYYHAWTSKDVDRAMTACWSSIGPRSMPLGAERPEAGRQHSPARTHSRSGRSTRGERLHQVLLQPAQVGEEVQARGARVRLVDVTFEVLGDAETHPEREA